MCLDVVLFILKKPRMIILKVNVKGKLSEFSCWMRDLAPLAGEEGWRFVARMPTNAVKLFAHHWDRSHVKMSKHAVMSQWSAEKKREKAIRAFREIAFRSTKDCGWRVWFKEWAVECSLDGGPSA